MHVCPQSANNLAMQKAHRSCPHLLLLTFPTVLFVYLNFPNAHWGSLFLFFFFFTTEITNFTYCIPLLFLCCWSTGRYWQSGSTCEVLWGRGKGSLLKFSLRRFLPQQGGQGQKGGEAGSFPKMKKIFIRIIPCFLNNSF